MLRDLKKERWEDRIRFREDMSIYLTHLVRGRTDEQAFNKLFDILKSKKIRASSGRRNGYSTVHGGIRVVCFQDLSRKAIKENMEADEWLNRAVGYRFAPFGIRVNKQILFNAGARPVIYDHAHFLEGMLPKEEHWRIVDMDLTSNFVDWSHEREWRLPDDYPLTEICKILVKDNQYKRKFLQRYKEERRNNPNFIEIYEKNIVMMYE